MQPSIGTDYNFFVKESSKLQRLLGDIRSLSPKYQTIIGEIVMLRLFGLLEITLCSVAKKIVCGARYLDGSAALTLHNAKSISGAELAMKKHNRPSRVELRWSSVRHVKKNIEFVIDKSDNYVLQIDKSVSEFNEMRRIRNYIAHRNQSTRQQYRGIVSKYYGAYVNRITPGILIMNEQHVRPRLIDQYFGMARTLVGDLVKK